MARLEICHTHLISSLHWTIEVTLIFSSSELEGYEGDFKGGLLGNLFYSLELDREVEWPV